MILIFLLFLRTILCSEFFSYGLNNEFHFHSGVNISEGPIELSQSIVFFNKIYVDIYIHSNGYISFNNMTISDRNSIAIVPFLCQTNTSLGGIVSFREIFHDYKLSYFSKKIGNFTAKYGFIVTWYKVKSIDKKYSDGNTFQMVLLSNGIETFTILNLYDIQWNDGQNFTSIIKNYDGVKVMFKNTSGIWIFRVDQDLQIVRYSRKKYKIKNFSAFVFGNFYLIIFLIKLNLIIFNKV